MVSDPFALVGEYHRNLPDRIVDYLHRRGISDDVITLHRLGWNGQRITIPVFTREGALAFFKFAKDPADQSDGPKMLTSLGGSLDLYGWERVLTKPSRLIVCEGEFDRLVLETQGLAAVTSTGGAGSFRPEWAQDLAPIPEVYLCFDRDEAGRNGMLRVAQFVPHAKMVDLPDEVGPGGDVSDFFVRLSRSRDEFVELLNSARPIPVPPATLPVRTSRVLGPTSPLAMRVTELKRVVPIADLIGRYVTLRVAGQSLRGRCLFHEDHNPSLMVNADSGKFRCYGCGRHGDVIDFFMLVEKLPFLRALDALDKSRSGTHEQPPTRQ